jgi:hypothetical protein
MKLLAEFLTHSQACLAANFLRDEHQIYSVIYGCKGQGYRIIVNSRDVERGRAALEMWNNRTEATAA